MIAVSLLLGIKNCYAVQTVINTPVVATQTTANDGDEILVTGTGSITTTVATPSVELADDDTILTVQTATIAGGGAIRQTGSAQAVQIEAGSNRTTINNAGTIQNTSNPTIRAMGLVTAATLINSGTISGNSASAIDYANVTTGVTSFTNNAGAIIQGGILLSGANTATSNITINGGTINGNMVLNVAGGAATQFNININNDFTAGGTLGSAGAGFNATSIAVNNNGTAFNSQFGVFTNQFANNAGATTHLSTAGNITIVGAAGVINNNGTLNLSDVSAITGAGTINNNSIMNLSNGARINTTTVNNAGTLTLANTPGTPIIITGNVNNTGTLNLQTTPGLTAINGNLVSSGLILLSTAQNISGNYTQNAGGNFQTSILNTACYGRLNLIGVGNTVTLAAGSSIKPLLLSNGTHINEGDTFDVFTSLGAINDTATLLTAGNPLITFTKSTVATGVGNAVRLTAHRVPLTNFINPDQQGALGSLLQTFQAMRNSALRNTQPFPSIFRELDATLRNNGSLAFEQSLYQFLPDVSGALRVIPLWQLENMDFKALDSRLERIASLERRNDYIPVTGYVAGDSILGQENYGPLAFASTGQQKVPIQNFPYDFNTGGLGLFWDRGVSDCLLVGLTGSYNYTTILFKNNTGSKTTVGTSQGGLYASYNHGFTFIDGIASYGFNFYQSKRVQPLIAQTSLASFKGNQASIRLRGGYAVPIRWVDVIPMGSIQYSVINIGSYTENGGAALFVPWQKYTAAIWGAGLRLSLNNLDTDVKTEIHGMYYQDMKISQMALTSALVAGGPAFITYGNSPKRNHYNAGASVNLLVLPGMTLNVNYEFNKQEGLKASSFFLRWRWIH